MAGYTGVSIYGWQMLASPVLEDNGLITLTVTSASQESPPTRIGLLAIASNYNNFGWFEVLRVPMVLPGIAVQFDRATWDTGNGLRVWAYWNTATYEWNLTA